MAVDVQNEDIKKVSFFEDKNHYKRGSTLCKDKHNIHSIKIECNCCSIDSIFKDITVKDYVVLKIDIEGKEYDVVEYMIKSNLIDLIDELYIDWHWKKIPSISKERHDNLLSNLQSLGYNLTGEISNDDFRSKSKK
jgi:hypothetical protein